MILSIDAMGGDDAPNVVISGLAKASVESVDTFLLHGDRNRLEPMLADYPGLRGRAEVRHTDLTVKSGDKPSQALRRAKGTSMWNAVDSVKSGEANAAVSAGNTGALMAISMLALRKMEGVHRPAMTAIWPTMTGRTVVLDVGANLEADATQLLTFTIMGEAFARAITGKAEPTVGLLNIGSEELKGHDDVREAAELIRQSGLGLNYIGFVEGDDISAGVVDVVVTDGFTGNVALKTAEGTARLVASYVRDALTSSAFAKAGAVLASSGLRSLRERMNPSNVNGGVLLGLNGLVVKSHGGTDADGFATAVKLASTLAASSFPSEVAANLARVSAHTSAA